MTGLMRVKNEARFIDRAIRSIQPLCERILILDDHSTDGTPHFAEAFQGVTVQRSPFQGLDESRDKNHLLEQVRGSDWVLMIDGDEELTRESVPAIRQEMSKPLQCISPRILFMWNREDQVRVDGVYGRFYRPSIFRPGAHRFESNRTGPNFHCGNAPAKLWASAPPFDGATLLHYGYLHKADRIRKYEWYNQHDPDNRNEDMYRHIVAGDLFEADAKMKHAGPLELRPLADVLRMAHGGAQAGAAQ